jgi:hypothetical protein
MMRSSFFAIAFLACSPNHELPAHVRDTGAADDVSDVAAYAEGPFGGRPGQTFPDFSFEGYRANSDRWETISLHDYWDPDGAKGTRALVVISAVRWCPACQEVARNLGKTMEFYAPKGTAFLHLLRESKFPQPATKEDVDLWRTTYGRFFDSALDGANLTFNLQPPNERGQPMVYIINTRTMVIYKTIIGGWIGSKIVPLEKFLAEE